jgi:hypothetical protein
MKTTKKRRPEKERRKPKHRMDTGTVSPATMEVKVGNVKVEEQLGDITKLLTKISELLDKLGNPPLMAHVGDLTELAQDRPGEIAWRPPEPPWPRATGTAQWVEGEPPRDATRQFMGRRHPRREGTLYANQPSDAEVYREYLKEHEHDTPGSVRPVEQR